MRSVERGYIMSMRFATVSSKEGAEKNVNIGEKHMLGKQ